MRYKVKVEPNEGTELYYNDQYMSFTLPNEIIDLSTLNFMYDATGDVWKHITVGASDYRSILRFLPKLSSGVIDEITISRDNKIIQNIKNYNYIDCLLNDLTKDDDDEPQRLYTDTIRKRDIRYVAGVIDGVNQPIIASVTRPQALTTQWWEYDMGTTSQKTNYDTYFVSKWLGFLNMRYLDARKNNYTIQIKLAQREIMYNGLYYTDAGITTNVTFDNSTARYRVRNPYFIFDVLSEPPTEGFDNMFMHYDSILGYDDYNSKKTCISIETKEPVIYALGTFTKPQSRSTIGHLQMAHVHYDNTTIYGDRITNNVDSFAKITNVQPLDKTYTVKKAIIEGELSILNNSSFFDRCGTAVSSAFFKLNSFKLCPDMNIVDIYNQTKKYLKTDMKRITSVSQFKNNFFAHIIGIDDMSEDYKKIEWNVRHDILSLSTGGIAGGAPMLMICTLRAFP